MKKENKLLVFLSILCVAAFVFMIVALCIPKKTEEKLFIPPPFDDRAVLGEPTVPEGLGYDVLNQSGMSFVVALCGKVNVIDNKAQIYLTNVAENTVWLKARFYDSTGNIVGESGLIKPGEYLKEVMLLSVPRGSEQYKLKIMSYEPYTYNSLGEIIFIPKMAVR